MEPGPSAPPVFGDADLSNCEREPIQFAASIQPHGALLVVGESGLKIIQASGNASSFLGLDCEVLGQPLDALGGDLAASITPHLDAPLDKVPIAVRCHLGDPFFAFDGLVHRPDAGGLSLKTVPQLQSESPPWVVVPYRLPAASKTRLE